MNIIKTFLVRVLKLLFSPIIDKYGFIKLPKDRRTRSIVIFVLMLAVLLTAFAYEVIIAYLYKIPTLFM